MVVSSLLFGPAGFASLGGYRERETETKRVIFLAREPSFLCRQIIFKMVAFSSRVRILGDCSIIHSPPALFFKVEMSSLKFHSFGQDQSTVAQRAETTVTECFLMKCL